MREVRRMLAMLAIGFGIQMTYAQNSTGFRALVRDVKESVPGYLWVDEGRPREDTRHHSREERSIDCREGCRTAQQTDEGMGGFLLGRLSVEGVSRGKRLRAAAHGSFSQPQEPTAVSAEVCGHILR